MDTLAALNGIELAILTIVLLGVGTQLLGLVCLVLFSFRKAPALSPEMAKVGLTMIKPCFGVGDGERENFDTFFRQNYPGPFQLLFVVSNETDPVVPVVKEYLARYPQIDAELVISRSRKSFRRKVDALYDGHQVAKHEIVLWSDSDTYVKPDYFSQVMACFQDPGISIATIPQYDMGANDLPTGLKTLGNNCDLATYVLSGILLFRKHKFAWGHSMAFRRTEFDPHADEIWELMNRFMADDQALPYFYCEQGKKVAFNNIYCPVVYANKTLKDVIVQKERFAMCQRVIFPNRFLYLLGLLGYPQVTALMFLVATGFSTLGWQVFGGVAAVRITVSFLFEAIYLKSIRMSLRYFWTIFIWDLMQIYFFFQCALTNTIVFHGKKYELYDRYYVRPV